jgi:hypothetical protein
LRSKIVGPARLPPPEPGSPDTPMPYKFTPGEPC